jgi:hypothetical protein
MTDRDMIWEKALEDLQDLLEKQQDEQDKESTND